MNQLNDVAIALREIPGVAGVLLLDPMGSIQFASTASFVPEDVLPSVASRLAMVNDAMSEAVGECQEFVLVFDSYLLMVRNTPHGLLATLAEKSVNPDALRMGANVVARRLTMMGGGQALSAAPPVQPPSAAPSQGLGYQAVYQPGPVDGHSMQYAQEGFTNTQQGLGRGGGRVPTEGQIAQPSGVYGQNPPGPPTQGMGRVPTGGQPASSQVGYRVPTGHTVDPRIATEQSRQMERVRTGAIPPSARKAVGSPAPTPAPPPTVKKKNDIWG
jgi:hypothetical protein